MRNFFLSFAVGCLGFFGCGFSSAQAMDVSVASEVADLPNEEELTPMRIYDFEFVWLPFLAYDKELMSMDSQLFDSPERVFLITMMQGYEPPFEVRDITVSEAELDGKSVTVWTFPEPSEDTLCRYMAFVPTKDGLYRLFTLERSELSAAMGEKTWWIGEAVCGGHSSYVNVDAPADAQGFVDMLKNLSSVQGISSSYK